MSLSPDSQGPTIVAVSIVFAVVSLITIVLRLWARAFVVGSVGADDWLICVAVLLSWAFIGCAIAAVQYGMGDRMVDVEPLGIENMITYSQIVWLSSIFYNACLGFIKISVLALYMRLGDKNLRRVAIVMLGVIICQAGGNVFACIFQCTPVEAAYRIDMDPEEMSCVNINAFYLANAAVNILTDIMTYTLPIPLVIKLKVPRRQKIGLGIILGLGLFACVSSIIRITYIPPMLTSEDATYVISGAMYWSVIETNVGILAASIPSYKAIAKKYMPRLLGSSYDSSARKFSGFRMMNKPGSKAVKDDDATVVTRSKGGFDTSVRNGTDDNSSEEVLVFPGRIGVRTDIVHQYEDASGRPNGGLPIQNNQDV